MPEPKEKFTPCYCTISEGANHALKVNRCSLCSASGAMYEALQEAFNVLRKPISERFMAEEDEALEMIEKALALVDGER